MHPIPNKDLVQVYRWVLPGESIKVLKYVYRYSSARSNAQACWSDYQLPASVVRFQGKPKLLDQGCQLMVPLDPRPVKRQFER